MSADAAADVWCTIQLYRRLLALADIADRQVDVQALLSDVTQPATPAPSTVSTTSGSLPSPPLPPTARQTQAYDLVYGDNCLPRDGDALPIDAVARQMGIQPSSVVSVRRDVMASTELGSTSSTDAFARLRRTCRSPSCWRCSTRGAIRSSSRDTASDCSTLSDRSLAHIVRCRCTCAREVNLTSCRCASLCQQTDPFSSRALLCSELLPTATSVSHVHLAPGRGRRARRRVEHFRNPSQEHSAQDVLVARCVDWRRCHPAECVSTTSVGELSARRPPRDRASQRGLLQAGE